PSVARSIAAVLDADEKKNGYIQGGEYLISWCVGHLVSLAPPEQYDSRYGESPWKFENLPIAPANWQFNLEKATRAQFDVLKELMFRSDVSEIICATDAGREGECIFRYVYNFAHCNKPVKRLWTSSLEESAIRQGFAELKDDREYDRLFEAGYARAKADWLVGMNATRLFSIRYRTFLSVGRVQTPTLAMIVDRSHKVTNFIKEKFYTVDLDCGDFIASSERFDDHQTANSLFVLCNGKKAVVSDIKREKKSSNPPKLYDLTTLQREANRLCGYTAQQTLDYTQSLYEQKLVTYPRTDSQYITEDMEQTALSMVKTVCACFNQFAGYVNEPNIKRCINNSKVSDHHAIIPTEQICNAHITALPSGERNILLLIAARLLLATSEPHLYESIKVTVECESHNFFASGKSVTQIGYKALEKVVKNSFRSTKGVSEDEESSFKLPTVSRYNSVPAKISEHYTAPPKQFTEDTLLSAMETAGNSDYVDGSDVEKKGLGTPATRAGIIETLVKRGYISRVGKKLIPTDRGISLINAVPNEVKSPKMTAEWETALQAIEKGTESADSFMSGIENYTRQLVSAYSSTVETSDFAVSRQFIGVCPKCGRKVVSYPKSYSCSSGKDGCGFVIWKTIAGKSISQAQAEKLLNNGRTDLIKGFASKTGKSFNARLKLNPDTSVVEFEFENKGGKSK
ncbi:MAG: DNA topoisomerase 3, partial [Ruminococcus sp.]|nr:DNA topoisomerase 3 [Ruminococcus sp.]